MRFMEKACMKGPELGDVDDCSVPLERLGFGRAEWGGGRVRRKHGFRAAVKVARYPPFADVDFMWQDTRPPRMALHSRSACSINLSCTCCTC